MIGRPAVLFFDLYGTLIDIDTDEGADATRHGFVEWVTENYGEAAGAHERDHPLFDDIRNAAAPGPFGEPDLGPVINAHLETLLERTPAGEEVAAAATAFRAASRVRFGLFPGVVEALDALVECFRLGLVSNAQWLFTGPELEQLGLSGRFDPLVISSDVGVRKPGREIFERALAGARAVRPTDVLHVGDDPEADVAGAAAVGIRTCLVGPVGQKPQLAVGPDLRVASVADLPPLLLP